MTDTCPGMKFSLIPRKNRRAIFEYLFREGVIVVEKNPKLMEHPDLKNIPNLHVMMSLRSLKSHNFVTETFNWQHHYYVLTNEGIEHLRDILHLPSHVQPDTHTRKAKPMGARREERRGEEGERRRGGFGRGRGGGRGGDGGGYGMSNQGFGAPSPIRAT